VGSVGRKFELVAGAWTGTDGHGLAWAGTDGVDGVDGVDWRTLGLLFWDHGTASFGVREFGDARIIWIERMDNEAKDSPEVKAARGAFRTTRWSLVARAGTPDGPGAAEALEELCGTYWHPVYGFVRRAGRTAEEAEDLVQGFFAKLLEGNYLAQADRERGKFRTFLLAAVKNFLANEYDRAAAQKRGGGMVLVPLDGEDPERRFAREPSTGSTPEAEFERRWAETILENALQRVREEFDGGGKVRRFDHLKPFLLRQKEASYREACEKLGLTESAVKSAIYRMRQRFQAVFREEIGRTVAGAEEIDAEIRHLLEVLSR